MRGIKQFGIVLLCAMAAAAHSKERNTDFAVKGGCVVRAHAYKDKTQLPKDKCRYDLEIVRTPKDSYQWDFTVPEDEQPNAHFTGEHGAVSPTPYGTKKQTTIRAVLHQYDTYEERITFRNLEVRPITSGALGVLASRAPKGLDDYPRCLSLKKPVTATTPSGVSITLPTQRGESFADMLSFNGNPDALFIKIKTSPDQREVFLPKSPLCKKHGKPVRIKLDCPQPKNMASYRADNAYKTIMIGMPDLKTVTHLDTLTLIVRQRVDLQSIPLALRVPILRSPSQ